MKHIRRLVNDKDNQKMSFTEHEKFDITEAKIISLSEHGCLELTMEEVGELIEVVAKTIDGKKDYYHIAEEICDVMLSTYALELIFMEKHSHVKYEKKGGVKKKKQQSITFEAIQKLSKTQRMLSKCIRHGYEEKKYQKILRNLNDCCESLIKLFGIKEKDIQVITNLKLERDKKRYIKRR